MTDMQIVIRGRHVDVSPRFRDLADEKLSRIERFGISLTRVDVELFKEPNPRMADQAYKVELTCRGRGPVIRAEASAADEFSPLDIACGKLEEQLRRAHDKSRSHRNGRNAKRIDLPSTLDGPSLPNEETPDASAELDSDELYAQGPVVVRDKTHPTEPMTIEQAVTEMELVGHDFFLFHEVESQSPAVVYRRRGFDYGLIRIDTTPVASNQD